MTTLPAGIAIFTLGVVVGVCIGVLLCALIGTGGTNGTE